MSRQVTLVLTTSEGRVLGALPSFAVSLPYWQEVREIVDAARELYGVEATVLRLLSTEPGLTQGGHVGYLAEVATIPDSPLAPASLDTSEHPLRPDYARPGGPGRSLDWARSQVDIVGVEQQRTWNLSAIWRLATPSGTVWLKQVPSFFAHEASVLSYLDRLRAADGHGRMLLDNLPGDDLYGADLPTRLAIAEQHFALQSRALADVPALLASGVPDRRDLGGLGDQAWLGGFVDAVGLAGMPDTLVHGDLHPGNVIGTTTSQTIIDWGDSFVGQPGFDILRLSEDLDAAAAKELIQAWAGWWRDLVPECDPLAAIAALRPVAALRNARSFADFLANIEPSEHPYHAADVPYWLAEAERLAAT